MIEAQYVSSAKEMDNAYDIHWKYSLANFARLPLLGTLLLIVYIISMYVNFLGMEMLFLFGGLYCFLFPMAAKTGLKKNIKSVTNKNFTITLDDSTITIKTDGIETKANLDILHSTIATENGLLVYPQPDIFYWVPKNAFKSSQDFDKAIELLGKSIKKASKPKSSCGCCSCG